MSTSIVRLHLPAFAREVFARLKTTVFFSFFEIKKQTAGSGSGLVWMGLEPLLRVAIYIFIFTAVLRIRLPGDDSGAFGYAIYILMGLVPWMYISAVLNEGAGLLHSYAGFIRQPNFPYRILPNVILLTQIPAHAVGMAAVLVMMGLSGDMAGINIPLLLLVYVLMLVAIRGGPPPCLVPARRFCRMSVG